DLSAALAAAGYTGSVTGSDVFAVQQGIASSGLPTPLQDLLRGIGATGAEVFAATQVALVQDNTAAAGDGVTKAADPALIGLLQQATAALAALPPPAPKVVAVSGAPDGSTRPFTADAAGGLTPAGGPVSPFPGFAGDVRTATGDFDGDGVKDTVLVTGPGVKTVMTVVSGKDGSTLLPATDPFGDANFTFGGFVTAGDLDGDGRAEWVVTPELRGGPRVIVFRLNPSSPTGYDLVANFFGIQDDSFRDGARAALGDVNLDGVLDVFCIAAFNGGPRTALFDGKDVLLATGQNRAPTKLVGDFFATTTGADVGRGGRSIAAGDVNGDGVADYIVSGDTLTGDADRVTIFSGADILAGRFPGFGAAVVADFGASGLFNSNQVVAAEGQVNVATVDADGDNRADLVVGAPARQQSLVKQYLGKDLSGTAEPPSAALDAFGTTTFNGVFVG